MTGKRYYLTTLGAWQRHAHRFANSHFISLDAPPSGCVECGNSAPAASSAKLASPPPSDTACAKSNVEAWPRELDAATRIAVLVEGDEGAHLALEDDTAFEALPHPFAPQPISVAAQAALAAHGVAPGATTFDAAEALARLHPLLKPRVF